jgi:A/G-specific adenine glycosylase
MVPNDGDRFREDLLGWAEDNLRDFPWRDPEASLYEVFVAEFFLTQTPAMNVAVVYHDFLERYPSLESIRETDRDDLEEFIEPLGFYRMRADALSEIASRMNALPDQERELRGLPRVGPYVANATLCFALERPRPIVDRNVVRAYGRIFGSEFPDKESARREFAVAMLPSDGKTARTYNLALLDFGALLCKSGDPRCEICFASDYCDYYDRREDTN